MSKDKNKSIDRFYNLFTRGRINPKYYAPGHSWQVVYQLIGVRNMAVNCEGGIGIDNDVIKWGLRRGYLRIRRNSDPKWSHRFKQIWGNYGHIHGMAYRSAACLTESGKAFIFKEMKKRGEKSGDKIFYF